MIVKEFCAQEHPETTSGMNGKKRNFGLSRGV